MQQKIFQTCKLRLLGVLKLVIISSDANAINIWYLPGQLYLRFYPCLDYHYKYMSLCYPNNVWKFQNTSSKSLEDFFPQNLISCTDKLCHSNKLSPKQGWKISHVSEAHIQSTILPLSKICATKFFIALSLDLLWILKLAL